MLAVDLECIGRDLIQNSDRYTHQVCILPSAYLLGQLPGFEVEETYPKVPVGSPRFGGSTTDLGGRLLTLKAIGPQILFCGKISQKLDRGLFVQGFVSRAALGRVDARRASL